jgi:hypothetical protein
MLDKYSVAAFSCAFTMLVPCAVQTIVFATRGGMHPSDEVIALWNIARTMEFGHPNDTPPRIILLIHLSTGEHKSRNQRHE